MNIIFMGTPEFSVPSLKTLIDNHNVSAVFTQPDRPKGRGKKLAMSPVKEVAVKNDIPVYQPLKIRNDLECIQIIRDINPDFIIVVAFGQILPKEILDIPKYGCINLHASMLPKYRGAAPINWSVINGEKYSGNTTMLMDVGLDTGDMLLKSQVPISQDMTSGELHDLLMVNGADLLLQTIDKFANNEIIPQKQNDEESCYASMLTKETGKIDWNMPADKIKNLIRGLNPWPIAYTSYNGETMKIHEAGIIEQSSKHDPGYILDVDKHGIKVSTSDGIIVIKIIQFPGGKPLKVEEYLKGNKIDIGQILL